MNIRATFRVPAELYRQAQRIAAARHETVTHVVISALRDYVEQWQDRYPPKP